MWIGLAVYGGLDGTSGGYRYDRELVAALERRGDGVSVISIRRPTEEPMDAAAPSTTDRTSSAAESMLTDNAQSAADTPELPLHDRLDRPFDVLLQDELCRPVLRTHNDQLSRPNAIVSIVHYLRSADPGIENKSQVREREREYLDSVDGAICTSRYTRKRTTAITDLSTLVAPPAGRHEGTAVSRETVRERARTAPLQVLFVGNLVPRKGTATLFRALAHVDRDWQLTVVGSQDADPAYTTRLRDRAAALDIEDRVTFAGRVDDAALEASYRRSHVLAVPSRCEPFGMVYLEGMEYGVVPIATRVGGAREFVTDGRNGVLVDPNDLTEIAAQVRDLAADRDRLARLGTAALETAADHPTWDETMADVRSFLQAIASGVTSADGDAAPDGDPP